MSVALTSSLMTVYPYIKFLLESQNETNKRRRGRKNVKMKKCQPNFLLQDVNLRETTRLQLQIPDMICCVKIYSNCGINNVVL